MLNELKEVYRTVAKVKEAALTFTADGEEYLRSFHPPERLILLGCGSTPVKSGAMMAVDKVGRTVGTIGGGCGEGAVLKDAYRIIGSGTQCTVTVDMSNDIAEEEGMVCGGEMKVLIADVSPE